MNIVTPANLALPAPSAFEHSGFKIFPIKIRSRIDGTVKTMLAVQCNENREREKRGEPQIGGDCLFDTVEQAMAAASRQWERMESDAQWQAELAAKEKAAAEAEAARVAMFADFVAYKQYSAPSAEKARRALLKPIRRNGEESTIKALVDELVEDGRFIGDFDGERVLEHPDGRFVAEKYIGKTGMDYAEYLISRWIDEYLIAQLAMHKQTSVNKIYDPACGSGSLLLQAKKHFDAHIIEDGFFGQEINHTTYNLARMNMLLHNINYVKFNIRLGNTLIAPYFGDEKPFDAIVSNPPYSVKWIGSDDPTLINDDRFSPAGVLAPKSKADFAFVLHALDYLSPKGRAAIVCFPGIFYRGGAEAKIRQYLVDNNYVESVILLAPNLFFGTAAAMNILVLSKHKTDTTTQFINAGGLFKKETNNNVLLDAHIEQIMAVFDSKADVSQFALSIPLEQVVTNDYNLSVSSYIEARAITR